MTALVHLAVSLLLSMFAICTHCHPVDPAAYTPSQTPGRSADLTLYDCRPAHSCSATPSQCWSQIGCPAPNSPKSNEVKR